MTRRQRARERRAYNRWRRWAVRSGEYTREEACPWGEWSSWLRDFLGRIPRDFSRVTGPRRMREASAQAKRNKASSWARRHL